MIKSDNKVVRMKDFYMQILQLWQSQNNWSWALQLINPDVEITMVENTPDDPRQRKPDISKAKELLGWEPKIKLRDGLPLMEDDFRQRLGVPRKKWNNMRSLLYWGSLQHTFIFTNILWLKINSRSELLLFKVVIHRNWRTYTLLWHWDDMIA